MKMRYFLTLLFLSITTFLSAQIWTAEVPYKTTFGFDGVIRDFIKTSDNGFLVLLQTEDSTATFSKSQHTMIKYDAEGTLEWNKSYDFGVNIPNPFTNIGGALPREIIQLANGNYLTWGGINEGEIGYPYIFITNASGDSLIYNQDTENYRDFQIVNDQIWTLRIENSDSRFLSELNENGNMIEENLLENVRSVKFVITPDETVFSRSGGNFRKNDITGEVLIEVPTDNHPDFFATNELNGVTAFGDELTKLDTDLNVIWDIEYEDLFPWSNSVFSPYNKDLFRTTSDDYIFYGSVYDDFLLDFRFPYIYKYSKDGEYIWGGTYSMNTLPYTYVAGVVEVEDGIVTIGGNVFDEKIQLVKLYPNGLGVPTSTEDLTVSKTDFHVFPNPVNNQLTIEFPEPITGKIQLINAQGQIMTTENVVFTQVYQLNLQNYQTGIYAVKVMTEQGFVNSQTIIKK